MITISSDPEMLNTARLAQCEDLQVTKNETRKVWTKRFCDPNCRADSAHLQSLARLVFNSALRTDDCIMRGTHHAHSRHSRHSRSTYFNEKSNVCVFHGSISHRHIATYRYISPYYGYSGYRRRFVFRSWSSSFGGLRTMMDDGTMWRSDVATCNRLQQPSAHRGTPGLLDERGNWSHGGANCIHLSVQKKQM